ncbi:hypothetical protein KJ918_03375, partial [Patescibacteria group bacterium]|nr:hypothetical protein [Patescibacteria group bacterium]
GKDRAYDDRDIEEIEQGEYEVINKGKYYTHHVTLRDLEENTRYFYRISTGFKTIKVEELPILATTSIAEEIEVPYPVYGLVTDGADRRVNDGIIYLKMMSKNGEESSYLSTYTNDEGGWSLDISNARDATLGRTFDTGKLKKEEIFVEGGELGSTAIEARPGEDQPVKTVKLEGKKSTEEDNAGIDHLISGAYAAQTSPKENACSGQDGWQECYASGFENPCCGSSGTCYEGGMYGVNGYWFCRGQGEWLGWCNEYYCEDRCSEPDCKDKIIDPPGGEIPDEGEVVYNPASLDFGTIEVGDVDSKTVQVSNNTSKEITIKKCSESGPFSAICPGSIVSKGNAEITIGVGYTDFPGDYDETLTMEYYKGGDVINIVIKAKVKIREPQADFPGCPPPSLSDLDTYINKDGCTWAQGKFYWDSGQQFCYKNRRTWDSTRSEGDRWVVSTIKADCPSDYCEEPSFGELSCNPPGCTPDCSGKECGSDGCGGTCSPGCQNVHGTTSCNSGTCANTCFDEWGDCDGVSTNGCETELNTLTNCGFCGDSCNSGEICSGGSCIIPECKFNSDCDDSNFCTQDVCDTVGTTPKCKHNNLSDGTACNECLGENCVCSSGSCVDAGPSSPVTYSAKVPWFVGMDYPLTSVRDYNVKLELIRFDSMVHSECTGNVREKSGILLKKFQIVLPNGQGDVGGESVFENIEEGCYFIRLGHVECEDTHGVYKTQDAASGYIWVNRDFSLGKLETRIKSCGQDLTVGNVDKEWIDEFNSKGDSFKLGYFPLLDEEKEAFVELYDWISRYPSFSSVMKKTEIKKQNLGEDWDCGKPGSATACAQLHLLDVYFDDEFMPFLLYDHDVEDAKKQFNMVMLHELIHIYDTRKLSAIEGTRIYKEQRNNWFKSIGWRSELDPRDFEETYCVNCGYETPTEDYGYTNTLEDLATSGAHFYPYDTLGPLSSHLLRCCFLEKAVFNDEIDKDCGKCPKDLSLDKLRDYYLAKDGKTWVKEDELPPAGMGSLDENLYASVLGEETENNKVPEILIDTYEDFGMDIPENKFVSSVELSENGLYEISINDDTTTVEVSDSHGEKLNLYADINENGQMDEGEDTSVFQDDIQIKKISDNLTYKIDRGWTLIAFPFDTDQESSVNTASELLGVINDRGGLVTHVATLREGKWLIYSERNGRSFGEDFKLFPTEGYFIKNYKETEIELVGNQFEESYPLDLTSGWNLVGIISPEKEYTAEGLINLGTEAGVGVDIITKWQSGRYENFIKEGNVSYGRDYKIFSTSGYFIRVKDKGGTIKP